MRIGNETDSCLFGEELAAYIYKELSSADQNAFEKHLLGCSGCTAEFADISFSRLGVFEWHRDEFVPLTTPHFEIPYQPKPTAAKISWIDSLRGLIASPMRIAFAGGSLAVLAMAVVIGITLNSSVDPGLSAGVPEPLPKTAAESPAGTGPNAPTVDPKPEYSVNVPSKREFKAAARPESKTRAVQAKATNPRKKMSNVPATAQNAPRLGNFVETEDSSLRLADLMADIDTKD
jgi:hypothetical protein